MRHNPSGTRQSGTRSSLGGLRPWNFLLAALIAAGFTLPGVVMAGGHNSGNSTGSDGGSGGDDETIGTLPILGNQGQIPLFRHVRDSRPNLYLQGNYDEILSTIVGFTGSGSATIESLPDGTVRLGLHGQLELQLDRGLLQVTGIQIGEHVPAAFRGAALSNGLAGQVGSAGRMRPGDQLLPVAGLDGLGLLGQTPWLLSAHSRTRGNYEFHAWADAGVLFVGQTY